MMSNDPFTSNVRHAVQLIAAMAWAAMGVIGLGIMMGLESLVQSGLQALTMIMLVLAMLACLITIRIFGQP